MSNIYALTEAERTAKLREVVTQLRDEQIDCQNAESREAQWKDRAEKTEAETATLKQQLAAVTEELASVSSMRDSDIHALHATQEERDALLNACRAVYNASAFLRNEPPEMKEAMKLVRDQIAGRNPYSRFAKNPTDHITAALATEKPNA